METPSSELAKNIIREITNPTEAIINLLYLIKHDTSDAQLVHHYATLAESQARCLVEAIQRESKL